MAVIEVDKHQNSISYCQIERKLILIWLMILIASPGMGKHKVASTPGGYDLR